MFYSMRFNVVWPHEMGLILFFSFWFNLKKEIVMTIALNRGSFLLQEAGKEIYSWGFNQQNFFFLEEALFLEKLVFLREESPVGEQIDDADKALIEVVG